MSEVEQDFSKENILELTTNLKVEFVKKYTTNESLLAINSKTKLQNSDENLELAKLTKLIRSIATKIGILLNPGKFVEKNYTIFYKELQNFSNHIFFLLSLLPLFYKNPSVYPSYFLNDLNKLIINLMENISKLCIEIELLSDDSIDNEAKEERNEERLIPIGLIWNSCDSLLELSEIGPTGVLSKLITKNSTLLNDVLEEIDDWLVEPSLGNEDFLVDEYSSDEEDKDDSKLNPIDDSNDNEEILKVVVPFVKDWQKNIKLIKLLFSSFIKSIKENNTKSSKFKSSSNQGEILDSLNALHDNISESVDILVSDILSSDTFIDVQTDFNEEIEKLNEYLKKMVKAIKNLNSNDEKRNKWLNVWEIKYFEKN
ncbi:hypothetical protein TBLA_0E01030 [Henningerozyma blattae CBS 6284]|uniref:Uncharacterized protein n=1 Tax=Henningerozyma blattae (strain ATCC 34711 / CBS 6284 / DSM 70876 / NBRC 10599 / NRRL Y-10934 / UCD 77-7) TaxID=1071380 RepID=I2H461_HENB6|nr:hypothetical protein TBLA_0E01030 [Tetrapisispora blattae CBS 6284]CCH61163.1 hypothetical protein TBLA_0E01030 [Tetrapisispora blattae CBS 6284]